MHVAPQVELTEVARTWLLARARARSLPARLVEPCRVVLLAAEGKQDKEIGLALGIGVQKASRWPKRFLAKGTAGLEKDAPRLGRTPKIKPAQVAEIVDHTLHEAPPQATQSSPRSMAKCAGIGEAGVRRIWHTGYAPVSAFSRLTNSLRSRARVSRSRASCVSGSTASRIRRKPAMTNRSAAA